MFLLYDVWRDNQGARGKRGQGDQEVRKHSVSLQHADPGPVIFILTYPSAQRSRWETRKWPRPESDARRAPLSPQKHKCEQPEAAALASPPFNYSAESMSSGHVKALLSRRGRGISTRASTERPLRQDAAARTGGERRGGGTGGAPPRRS